MKKYKYILNGLDCASCADRVEKKLSCDTNLKNVSVNFSSLSLKFQSDLDNPFDYVRKLVKDIEPGVKVVENDEDDNEWLDFFKIILGVVFIVIGNLISNDIFSLICIFAAYVILLYDTFYKAFVMLFKSFTIDEKMLITISCIGAFLIGEVFEGFVVILLYNIGEVLEGLAVNHSRKSISGLLDLKPEYANMKNGKKVNPEDLSVGDIIVIKTGEKIPLDGVVVRGSASLDMSSLTGEVDLVSVKVDDNVLSGSICVNGLLEVRVSHDYANSTVSKILELIENANDKKAPIENMVSSLSRIYTPIMIGISFLIFILYMFVFSNSFFDSIYRALVILVISCPCSIVISVPLSYFSGIGRASRDGILIKGSNYLDALGNVKKIVFDKTGTLTDGNMVVDDVNVFDKKYSKEDVLRYAALGEQFSNHPIACAIVNYYDGDLSLDTISDYKEIAGMGISYSYKKKCIMIGNQRLVNSDYDGVTVSIDDNVIGNIVLSDGIKPGARTLIDKLSDMGISCEMFTGDSRDNALFVSKKLGIGTVLYEMLPQDKYKELEGVINNSSDKVAFVGDGINDAPVLALADVGISMGGIGSDASVEASDVVIMNDDIGKIGRVIDISCFTRKIIKENLYFSFLVKILILIFNILGYSSMWQAIFADVGVTIITICNSFRILRK